MEQRGESHDDTDCPSSEPHVDSLGKRHHQRNTNLDDHCQYLPSSEKSQPPVDNDELCELSSLDVVHQYKHVSQ